MFPNTEYQWNIQPNEHIFTLMYEYQAFMAQLYYQNWVIRQLSFQNLAYQGSQYDDYTKNKNQDECFTVEKQNFQTLQREKQLQFSLSQTERQKAIPTQSRQKYGRNIASNIFRSLIKRIINESYFKKKALRIIQQRKLKITYEQFVREVNHLTINLSSYVKKSQMKAFITPQSKDLQSREFCTIFRILAKIYLRQEHVINIFYSKKINKESRNLHFVLARQMEQMFKSKAL